MLAPWRTATVIRILDETPSTRRFWFRVDELNEFDFKPGQFVTLDLPIHEAKNKRWRSYSIASWPDGSNVFELVIVLLEGGLGTTYLFHEVTVGTEILFRGPAGVFVLPEQIDRDLIFICTGTGVAPFRSMAHHILLNNIPHKDIYLVFGCRKMGDCLYGSELKTLEQNIPAFHYMPTFSREAAGQHLVRTGYVHDVYAEICNAKKAEQPGNAYTPAFYLCGWKNMIDEAKSRLLEMGYEKKDIHQELYG